MPSQTSRRFSSTAAIERLLGAEIIVQIGLGHAGALAAIAAVRGAGEAGGGEHLLGGLQDAGLVGEALRAGRRAAEPDAPLGRAVSRSGSSDARKS